MHTHHSGNTGGETFILCFIEKYLCIMGNQNEQIIEFTLCKDFLILFLSFLKSSSRYIIIINVKKI